jgi:hypothetical protein
MGDAENWTVRKVALTVLSQHLAEGTKGKQENHATAGLRGVNQGWDCTKNTNDNVLIATQPERSFYEWMVVDTSAFLNAEYTSMNNYVWSVVLREQIYMQLIMKGVSPSRCSLRHRTNMRQQNKPACLLPELNPSWEAANCAATQERSQHFMEPEGSLPFSQEPSHWPLIARQISAVHTIPSLSTNPRLGLPSGLLPSGFPTYSICIPLLPYSCYMPFPALLDFIILFGQLAYNIWQREIRQYFLFPIITEELFGRL